MPAPGLPAACYAPEWTGVTFREFGVWPPCVEQVLNGNGTILPTSLIPVGANTFRPAAMTGLQAAAPKLPVLTIPSTAWTVLPLPTVTGFAGKAWLNTATLPIWWPDRLTANTNGKP